MAIDAVECYIYNTNNIKDKLFINNLSGWRFVPNNENEYLSSYEIDINGIYLRYQPHRCKGKFSIKFNVPRLLTGDNISSIYCCNLQRLFETLQDKLISIINLKEAPHLRYWKVSMFENNINIIRNKDIIKSLYAFASTIHKTKRFTTHCIYEDDGTIYLGNAKNLNDSTIVIKFYLKLKQIEQTHSHLNINDYYESKIINLQPYEDILRLEIVTSRDEILKLFKPQLVYSSDPKHFKNNSQKTIEQNIGTFEDIMNYNFQLKMLQNVINEFNMDKIITTKKKLFKLIDNSSKLSISEKKTAKRVINTLNLKDKYHKKKPSISSIYKFKNWILHQGYHYIYSDKEVSPIILDYIISSLPLQQQSDIELYKNSSIFMDMWY